MPDLNPGGAVMVQRKRKASRSPHPPQRRKKRKVCRRRNIQQLSSFDINVNHNGNNQINQRERLKEILYYEKNKDLLKIIEERKNRLKRKPSRCLYSKNNKNLHKLYNIPRPKRYIR